MNPVLKFLYSPMVMISVFLHGLFLLMPLPQTTPAAPEKKAEAPKEEEEVKISSLQSLTRPAATPKPIPRALPAAAPKPLARPIVRAVPVARPPAPRPNPLPVVAPAPAPPSAPLVNPPAAAPVAAAPAAETEQQVQDYLGQFQSSLGAVGASETANLGVPYFLFPQPDLYFTADSIAAADAGTSPEPVRVEGIDDILWASRKRPDAALEELQTLFQGFTFSDAGQFGGGSVYKVSQGNTVRYVNLVQATDKTATFVVIWNRDPSAAQAAAPTAP